MKELISPAQSEVVIAALALLLTLGLGVGGWFVARGRGAVAALVGPLVWLAWQAHKYATRYDPRTGYFGLDKVSVLVVEIVVFVAVGAALGWAWRKINEAPKTGN